MRVDGPPWFGVLWNLWAIGPLAILLVVAIAGWLFKSGIAGLTVQESPLVFKAAAVLGGSWLLVALILTVSGRLRPMTKVVVLDFGFSALIGFFGAHAVISLWSRPPAGAAAEPATFEWVASARQRVEVQATTGPAAGTRFMFVGKDWGDARTRVVKDQPVPGKCTAAVTASGSRSWIDGAGQNGSVTADGRGAHHEVVHPDLVRGAAEALPAEVDGVEHAVHPGRRQRAVLPVRTLRDRVHQRAVCPGVERG